MPALRSSPRYGKGRGTVATVVSTEKIQIDRLVLGPFSTNSYVVTCRETAESIVVDAPGDIGKIVTALRDTNPRYILITHGHMDHISGLIDLKNALSLPVAVHPEDAAALSVDPDILLGDGDLFPLGAIQLQVLHTPGHTPGSICLLTDKYLIAGDTLFPGGPGHTRSPADFRLIIESLLQRIFPLPNDTQVYPGHGDATVLGKEKEAFRAFSARVRKGDLCGDVVWESY
jgi:glyoxylase-like metal-dependent hydrolase (beta-lactamase superfamily II)